MEKIKGLIDAPFTPFYENGEVNYEPIEAYAKLLVKNGLKGVFINGSSGEGYMLTDEERMKLAERWVEVAPSGFKVIVHVGSTCVKASHKLAAHAQKIGSQFRCLASSRMNHAVSMEWPGLMVRPGIESINSPFGPTVSRMALNSGFMKSRRSSAIDSSI